MMDPALSRKNAQIGVYPRHLRVGHCLRKRLEPAVWLELSGIRTPDRGVCVGRANADEDMRVLGNEDLVHQLPIYSADWFRQRQDGVLADP